MQAHHLPAFALAAFCAASSFAQDAEPPPIEMVISVAEQRLVLLRDGMWIGKYRVSTSKFGLGDGYGSYKTPVGQLRVCEKIGGDLPIGAVIKHRHATGEILPVNAPGRDPIVTRVIWLEGLEERNAHAKSRGIYIHGTVEEAKIGEPVSYGCIRMRSREVADLFDQVPIGTLVTIQSEKLPRYRRWTASEPLIIAAKTVPKQSGPAAAKSSPGLLPASMLAASIGSPRIAGKRPSDPLSTSKTEYRFPSQGAQPPVVFTQDPQRNAATREAEARDGSEPVPNPFKGSILFADLPGSSSGRPVVETPPPTNELPEPVAEVLNASAALPEKSAPGFPRVTFRTGLSPTTSVGRGIP